MTIISAADQGLYKTNSQISSAPRNGSVPASRSSSTSTNADTVSLSGGPSINMVSPISAGDAYATNLATLDSADQIENALLNVFGLKCTRLITFRRDSALI